MTRKLLLLVMALVGCRSSDRWIPPGKGWVCIADSCARPTELSDHPNQVRRERAWVVVYQRADGTIDYLAAPTERKCEVLELGPCEVLP